MAPALPPREDPPRRPPVPAPATVTAAPGTANAELAAAVTALTAVLAAHPEQMDGYLAARTRSGRPAWHHSGIDPNTTRFTALLIAEIRSLTAAVLTALRSNHIVSPMERLAAYEAVDAASLRSALADRMLRAATARADAG